MATAEITTKETDPLVPLPAPFEDTRGVIQTLVDGGVRTVQVITSKSGTVRANHYHRADSHYMYVIAGSMEYHYRPAGSTEPPAKLTLGVGQMVFTPPMVEHAVRFPEDTVFVNVTSESRIQFDYENDVVRVKLLSAAEDA